MGVMAVNVRPNGSLEGDHALGRHLATLPKGAPVIIMVHGFKYDPQVAATSPHVSLFAPTKGDGVSWPVELGANQPGGPLCIGFAWPARGTAWHAWRMAARMALPLAGLLTRIAAHGRRAHLIGHSMGARVCLNALAQAPAGSVGRVILLSAAVTRSEARAALASPAGGGVEVVNVLGRENALFDALGSAVMGRGTVGGGLGARDARWLDLHLDRAETQDGLARIGLPVGPPAARVCHWSSYTRAGIFALHRALLAERPLSLRLVRRVTASVAPQPMQVPLMLNSA